MLRAAVDGHDWRMPEPMQAQTGATDAVDHVQQTEQPASGDHDCVDECGEASFPASDPPAWWSGPPT